MFKKIIDNLKNLIRGEKDKDRKQTLRETLNYVKQEKKEETQRQKESRIQTRRLMSIRGYWNKEANIRAEAINNKPTLATYRSYKEYKITNKSNAKTLESFFDRVKSRILDVLELNKKIVYTLSVHLSKLNALSSQEIQDFHFAKAGVIITNEEEKELSFESLYDFYSVKLQEEMIRGSGWQLKSIDSLQVKLIPFSSLKGGCSVDLPEKLKNSNSVLHFRKDGNECLKWALTYGVFSGSSRVDKKLIHHSQHLNWENMYYPSSGIDMLAFEKNNPDYKVFAYGLEGERTYFTYYKSKKKYCENEIPIFYYDHHFFPIKSESIFHKFLFKSKKCFVCKSCLNNFSSQELLNDHHRYCQQEYQCRINYPKKGNIFFKKHSATMFHPICFYMDIEAILKPIDENAGPKTKKYQKHEFSCLGIYEVNQITGKNEYRVFTDLEKFAKFLYDYEEKLHEECKKHSKKVPKIPKEDYPDVCQYCFSPLEDDAVVHHSHFTGEFIGIVHNKCNLLLRKNYFIPVFCHNLMKYDEKFLIRHFGDTKIIARNLENFISFRIQDTESLDIRFIDSIKFLNSSLEKLVENLNGNIPHTKREIGNISGKGIFPYDYITSDEVLNETSLPPIEKFFSKLHNRPCSAEDYLYAQKMWKFYNCKTLRDYQLAYLKSDCILLADCVENFRKLCFNMFGLDPCHYISLPSLSFDCFLKTSKIALEKITNPTIYNFIEKGIKGGESFIAKRYAMGNNPYMENYDPNLPTSYLCLFDANSLYPTNMCKNLPYKNFKFLEEEEIPFYNWENEDCFLDVDLSIPEELKETLKDYPLFPEHINGKLIGNLFPKKGYILHSEYLKTGLKVGYQLDKINKILTFDSAPIMKEYIDNNAEQRKKATSDFEKNFWKDLSNILYGKSIEDVRKRINVYIEYDRGEKWIKKPYFMNIMEIGEKTLFEMKKRSVTLDKPIYIGKTILDLSKSYMAKFWYFYLKPKYGDKIQLLMTDTDSFFFEVFTEDFYEDIRPDINHWFDTSNFPDNFKTLSGNSIPQVNKKVLGKFKDELAGIPCRRFVGLRPKQYAFEFGGKTTKKSKGVTKDCMRDITFEDYVDVLHGNILEASMNVIRSKHHEMFSEEIKKKILDKNDEKRRILEDEIHTVPWGY